MGRLDISTDLTSEERVRERVMDRVRGLDLSILNEMTSYRGMILGVTLGSWGARFKDRPPPMF